MSPNTPPKALSIPELEQVYDQLATAIDAVGPDKTEHFLVKLALMNANALADGGNVARQWMLQALADPDVVDGMGLFVGNVPWDRGEKDITFTGFGIDPA